jgi:hypothetical protein
VGIKEVSDKVWLVSVMQDDLGFFDQETGRISSAENPLRRKKRYRCARYGLQKGFSGWADCAVPAVPVRVRVK